MAAALRYFGAAGDEGAGIIFSSLGGQCSIESDEGCNGFLCEGEEVTVANPFGSALRGEGSSRKAERGVEVTWFGVKLDTRVAEPAVVNRPAALKRMGVELFVNRRSRPGCV